MVPKLFVFLSCLLVCLIIIQRLRYLPNNVVVTIYLKSDQERNKPALKEMFVDYLRKFNKSYEREEFHTRFRHFKKNLNTIRKQNAATSYATFGVTKFSDWSRQEFSQMLSPVVGGCVPMEDDCPRSGQDNKSLEARDRRFRGRGRNVPARKDWREYGKAVGPVLDQDKCPVCWAFSTIGVIESMAYIKYGVYTRLSIQDLIDCSFNKQSEKTGCRQGRAMVDVFQYLCHGSGGRTLATEADYPLTFKDEECKDIVGERSLKRYVYSCNMDEEKLVEAISRGPVTAVVNADLLRNYADGVIYENCVTTEDHLNHAVQIVGYDKTAHPPYYIVRNSWGDDWGEKGYVRLAIGTNQCGIAFNIGELEVY